MVIKMRGKTHENFQFPIIYRRRHGHYSYCCWRRCRTFQVIDNNWNKVESVDVVFIFSSSSSSLLLISNIEKYGQNTMNEVVEKK